MEQIKSKEVIEKLCLFPEGTMSNGKALINFKKGIIFIKNVIGAFVNLTGLKPFVIKNLYDTDFNIACGAMDFVLHFSIVFCFEYIQTVCYEFPVFQPNEYLFENFGHLGDSKQAIFSSALSEIMSKTCSLEKFPQISYDNKLEYLSLIHGKQVKNT